MSARAGERLVSWQMFMEGCSTGRRSNQDDGIAGVASGFIFGEMEKNGRLVWERYISCLSCMNSRGVFPGELSGKSWRLNHSSGSAPNIWVEMLHVISQVNLMIAWN